MDIVGKDGEDSGVMKRILMRTWSLAHRVESREFLDIAKFYFFLVFPILLLF